MVDQVVELPVCDGRVNAEKLAELQGVGTETSTLDYKATTDLNDQKSLLEIAKDVAGMRSNPKGGYLVFGLDDHGNPAVGVPPVVTRQFDEAFLRGKLRKYLGGDLQIHTKAHDIDGNTVVILYVAPTKFGIGPMEVDGQYLEEGKLRVHFREGDIFVRHGTSVERMKRTDLQRVLAPEIELIKEQTRQEVARTMANVQANATGAAIAQGAAGSITWQLPQDEFDGAVLQAIRTNDRVAIRAATLPLVSEAHRLVRDPNLATDLNTLLSRIVSVAALGLSYDADWVFDQAISVLRTIYDLGADSDGNPRNDLAITSPQLWLAVGVRVEALGGLAIRMNLWVAARQMALHPAGPNAYYDSWLRHAIVEASRSNLLTGTNGEVLPAAFVGMARELVKDVPALRPDVLDGGLPDFAPGKSPQAQDPVLDSILQFDLAWCLIAELSGSGRGQFYTSFATFYGSRTMPLADRIIKDPKVRQGLLNDVGDAELKVALKEILEIASNQAAINGHWRSDLTSAAVVEFLGERLH